MAHPARSLPPLSFGDPELDAPPANDTTVDAFVNLPTLTFADTAPPPSRIAPAQEIAREEAPAEPVYRVPSIIPEPEGDPSFASAPPPKAAWPPDSVAPVSMAPTAPKLPDLVPAPQEITLEERVIEFLEGLFDRVPPWPDALRELKVPVGVAFALALALLWCQLGFAIHSMRAFVTAAIKLGE